MSKKPKLPNPGNAGKSKQKGNKPGWIGEGKENFERIRKGAEIVLRPSKPANGNNSNGKSEK